MSSHRRCDGLAKQREQGASKVGLLEEGPSSFCCCAVGRRPLNDGPIFSEVPPRRHAVLDTTPLNHTYRLHFLISDSYSNFDTTRGFKYSIDITRPRPGGVAKNRFHDLSLMQP